MQSIIRFGTKKGFQAFPSLPSFGPIGNELGSEQGLYLPASIIQSHAAKVQERGAEGIERCLVYSKRSGSSGYHVIALILPVEAGKPEWRDGAFIGVALFADRQMIREREALDFLESDLKELISEHPVSSGREEGVEPLNWKSSNRPLPPSLFSELRHDVQLRSAQLVPAYKPYENWRHRVASALSAAAEVGMERVIILPWHEVAPSVSGWTTHPQPVEPPQAPSPPVVIHEDIKRLAQALENTENANKKLKEENDRLRAESSQKYRKLWAGLMTTGIIAAGLIASFFVTGIRWNVVTNEVGQPKESEHFNACNDGPYLYYWESLAFRSMQEQDLPKSLEVDPELACLEFFLGQEVCVLRAALNLKGKVGSYFFTKRYEHVKKVLESHLKDQDKDVLDSLLCMPCLKYGIHHYQLVRGQGSAEQVLSFETMMDSTANIFNDRGSKWLEDLFNHTTGVKSGFLDENAHNQSVVIAVPLRIPRNELGEGDDWYAKAAKKWVKKEQSISDALSIDAKEEMIRDLTEYVSPEFINNKSSLGDTIVFWVPELRKPQ